MAAVKVALYAVLAIPCASVVVGAHAIGGYETFKVVDRAVARVLCCETAFNVRLYVPPADGVPDSVRVAALKVKPDGSVPVKLYVKVCADPVAAGAV